MTIFACAQKSEYDKKSQLIVNTLKYDEMEDV